MTSTIQTLPFTGYLRGLLSVTWMALNVVSVQIRFDEPFNALPTCQLSKAIIELSFLGFKVIWQQLFHDRPLTRQTMDGIGALCCRAKEKPLK